MQFKITNKIEGFVHNSYGMAVKINKLTGLAILLGSSLGLVAGCYTYGDMDCPPYILINGQHCDRFAPVFYTSVVDATAYENSTDNEDAYVVNNDTECDYKCVIDGTQHNKWAFPDATLHGNPCTPTGSGSGTGGGSGT